MAKIPFNVDANTARLIGRQNVAKLDGAIMELIKNAYDADATKCWLYYEASSKSLILADNGCGMEKAQCEKAFSPFYTTKTKRGGFGLPLFRMACEQTGGTASLSSCAGEGTTVAGVLCINHIDCPPLGKLGDTMAALIAGNESIRFCLTASGKASANF